MADKRHHDKHSLAERLRHMADRNGRHEYTIGNYWNVCDEAAERIEELERELAATQSTRDIHAAAMYDLARECGWSEVQSKPPVEFIRDRLKNTAAQALEEVDRLERELAEVTEERTALAKAYIAERDALLKYKAQALIATSAIEPLHGWMLWCTGDAGFTRHCRTEADVQAFLEEALFGSKESADPEEILAWMRTFRDADRWSGLEWQNCLEDGSINALRLTEAAPSSIAATVPAGWKFQSADFSMPNSGRVIFMRDAAGQKLWFSLTEEEQDRIPLYVWGEGATFEAAMEDARKNALATPVSATEAHKG